MPFEFSGQRDPAIFHLDPDDIVWNFDIPFKTVENGRSDIIVAALDVECQLDRDLLGNSFDAVDATSGLLSGGLFDIGVDLTAEGHDTVLGRDANLTRFDARFPGQFLDDGLLQLMVSCHNDVLISGSFVHCAFARLFE